ncbi:hypothetical protein [Fusobacterium sp.]|uniref:hypothetical protein n=1 Tax=Fusobacterium sp. TaxID=68766 RepID=UPI0025BB65EE|nr:hypothetical protein [Fusobacterium sp.]
MEFNMFTKVTYMNYLKVIDVISTTSYENSDENIEEKKTEINILIDNLRKNNELFFYPVLEAVSRLKNYIDIEEEKIEEYKIGLTKEEVIKLNRFSTFRYIKIEE